MPEPMPGRRVVPRPLRSPDGRWRMIARAGVIVAALFAQGAMKSVPGAEPALPIVPPAEAGMLPDRLEAVDRIVAEGLRDADVDRLIEEEREAVQPRSG